MTGVAGGALGSACTKEFFTGIASVSAIYGLGSPEEYEGQLLRVYRGTEVPMDFAMQRLVDIQYQRNQVSRSRGTFRVTGDTLEVFPPYEKAGYRAFGEVFGDAGIPHVRMECEL